MDTSTMQYPFGRCISCGKEFNSELRNECGITHCPWCGVEIDDFLKPDNQIEHSDDIYCEECGQRIFERFGKKNEGGNWIEGNGEKGPGVCSGPCERELCGNCGEWDEEGRCPKCHEGEYDQNIFKGREDERKCHCNNCGAKFLEGEIKYKGGKEFCPICAMEGCIADDPEEEVSDEQK